MSVYAEKTFDEKPCKSTLGRASREAESPSGRHGQSTASKGFLSSKGNWNKLSERDLFIKQIIAKLFYLEYNVLKITTRRITL